MYYALRRLQKNLNSDWPRLKVTRNPSSSHIQIAVQEKAIIRSRKTQLVAQNAL